MLGELSVIDFSLACLLYLYLWFWNQTFNCKTEKWLTNKNCVCSYNLGLKYGFWKKSLRKNATLSSWTLFHHICPHLIAIRMQHCHIPATDGVEFWISCKRPAFLSSFGLLQVIQNKHPWCWNVGYVTAGCILNSYLTQSCQDRTWWFGS